MNSFSEDAFKNDQKSIEILIAGHMYKIDFEEGLQERVILVTCGVTSEIEDQVEKC